ncbi:MAG: MogA/MoaB family molybdenum cofactor biosynthesis protein [Planctomycetota bacterium]|nr:MogA/MoaB family molybdenum cofactor biosynthesis protein [Planctomycetota bacterium]
MSIHATLIVVSDRAAAGERADETAELLRPDLHAAGFRLVQVVVVPDEREQIAEAVRAAAAATALVLTTGGTGIALRDVTPEATRAVIELEIPGLAELMRARSLERTIHAAGSRAIAGALGRAIVVNLPGRPQGARECFGFIAAALPHLVAVRQGPVGDASHGARDA